MSGAIVIDGFTNREFAAEELTLTANAQPALMATSIAVLRALEAEGVTIDAATCVAGHSLGEYSALCAAGALGLGDTARLLRIRGRAMQALDSVAELRADEIAAELPKIIAAADRGSVIAKDRCTSLLTKLARSGYAEKAVPILVERLQTAAPNQFPTYAEQTASVVTQTEKPGLIEIIRNRLDKITQRAKRERMEKLLRKLNG